LSFNPVTAGPALAREARASRSLAFNILTHPRELSRVFIARLALALSLGPFGVSFGATTLIAN
jgi:hypothetical protein